jgi:hypothetical protein
LQPTAADVIIQPPRLKRERYAACVIRFHFAFLGADSQRLRRRRTVS